MGAWDTIVKRGLKNQCREYDNWQSGMLEHQWELAYAVEHSPGQGHFQENYAGDFDLVAAMWVHGTRL